MTALGSPAYRPVADTLRDLIRTKQIPPGARLPSLAQLAAQYNVTTDIARSAIAILRTEGLVETRQGAGTWVRGFTRITRSSPGRLSRSQWGSGAAIQDADTGPRWRTVDVVVSEPQAPDDVAEALGLAPGSTVISRARRFLVDERPVQLATSYYPVDIARGTQITYTDTGPGGVYARLADLGHAPARFTERVVARAPHTDEAADLGLARATGQVFDLTRITYDEQGRCIEVNRMVLDASVYDLEYTFSA